MIRVRILQVVNELWGGGAEESTRLLSNEMNNRRDIEVAVFAVRASRFIGKPWDCIVFSGRKQHGTGAWTVPASALEYARAVSAFAPDLIHAHCELPELLVSLTPSNIPLVCTEHSLRPWRQFPLVGTIVRQLLSARSVSVLNLHPGHVIVDGPVIARQGCSHFTISNPVEEPALGKGGEHPRLVYVGSQAPGKNVSSIVALSAQVGMPLVVVGDGPEMSASKDEAKQRGADVSFIGHSGNPWMHVGPKDIFVSMSLSEMHPLAPREALLAGLPCVLSDIPAHTRLEPFGARIIRPSYSASEHVRDLRALEATSTDALRAKLVIETDVSAIVDQVLRIYVSVIRRDHAPST